MSMQITYTGADALLDLKQYHPKNWMQLIEKAKADISSFKRLFKTDDAMQAYNAFLRKCGRPDNAVAILAAIYTERHKDRNCYQHVLLESRALRVEEQLKKLELTDWPEAVKDTLREFYHGRIAALQDKLNDVLNQMPVFSAEIISD